MKIVLFHYYSKKPNPVYQEMAASFRKRGHDVWILEPDLAGQLLLNGADGIEKSIKGPAPTPRWAKKLPIVPKILWRIEVFLFLRRVRQVIKWLQPDIVQVNPPVLAWFLPIGMPKNIHFILDIRQINEAVNKNFRTKMRERSAVRGMQFNGRYFYEKTCFCHEQAAIRILGQQWQEKGVVVPVGVDDQFNDFQHTTTNHPVSLRSFVYIGTLSRLRNLERLFYAAQHLCKKTDQFKLDLIGPDTSEGYYQSIINQLELQSVVTIKPAIPYKQVPQTLSNYDIGLAYVPDRPTWHYQPTIKVLEYRALGMPIISTDVASHREVVEQNVNGILCADTPEAIAEAMFQFINQPQFFSKTLQNALSMRKGNSWLDIADMYINKAYTPITK